MEGMHINALSIQQVMLKGVWRAKSSSSLKS
jgi:hypothetical protein